MVFTPAGYGETIFKLRWAFSENETWEEASQRVARHVGMAYPDYHARTYHAIINDGLFMPGGRIMYGSGRVRGQLLNCFVAPTEDSREGWGKSVSDMIVICGTGGGLGLNFSPVRPRNTVIQGTGGLATGAVSLMEIHDAAGNVIKAGGGRRTALMFCLGLAHGDILEFLDRKLDLGALTNANVSVVFDEDPSIFFKLVKENAPLELKFRGRVIDTVPARVIWDKIVKNAVKGGEPGILNGYLANKMSNVWYIGQLVSTNPCGEIWLLPYDCCCLGSLVLPRFVNPRSGLDWPLLRETVHTAVRFLDDVLTVNNYPLKEIAEVCNSIRRIGLGVTGLHDMLLLSGHKYNSPAGLEFVDKVMKFIKNEAYRASIELAKEKGPFPKFDADKFLKSNFIKTLRPTIREGIAAHGIRNCALLTIPPVGTGSIVAGVSSGIEPLFAPAYSRKHRVGDGHGEEVVVHPLFEQFVREGRDVSHFQSAHELSMRDHFEMQRVAQRHVDNAVSKTINIPQGTSTEELSNLYMEYFEDLKGVTVYPDGSRENQPLTPLSIGEALTHIGNSMVGATGADCKSGSCDL